MKIIDFDPNLEDSVTDAQKNNKESRKTQTILPKREKKV